MDVPRPHKPRRGRTYILTGFALVAALATVGIGRLRPAPPTLERDALWIDTVKRGPLRLEVRGTGTLVPEQIRWVSAVTAGRIEQVLARPGARVDSTTVLLVLSNPDVQLESLEAERQLTLAEASLASLESSLRSGVLAQEGVLGSARTELRESERGVKAAERLSQEGLGSPMELERAQDRATEARARATQEQERLQVLARTTTTQVALYREQVDRLRAIAAFQRGRIASMRVVAGARGVLQEMNLETGQWVQPGGLLAKVARPERLKAVLRVPEIQAKDVQLGQRVVVDTRNGTVAGRVSRTDPNVQGGAVAVDVTLEGPLPAGARPDLSVEGTIEIEHLPSTLHVGRPAVGEPNSALSLFKLDKDGHAGTRVEVRLGKVSVNAVQVLQGLAEGDRVVLSDMSRWDSVDRIRVR